MTSQSITYSVHNTILQIPVYLFYLQLWSVLSNIVSPTVVKEPKYRYYNNIAAFTVYKSADVMVLRSFDKYLVDITNIVVEEALLIDI